LHKDRKKLNHAESLALKYLEILYERKVDFIPALWKRLDDFILFAECFYTSFCELFNSDTNKPFNEDIAEYKLSVENDNHPTEKIYFVNKVLSLWKDNNPLKLKDYNLFYNIEQNIYNKNSTKIYLVFKTVKPYEPIPILLGNDENNNDKFVYLDEMSSFVQSLNHIWKRELMLYAFVFLDNPEQDINYNELRTKLGKHLAVEIFNQLKDFSSK
jgi:hypothetical protein